jgi:hypothetical protein
LARFHDAARANTRFFVRHGGCEARPNLIKELFMVGIRFGVFVLVLGLSSLVACGSPPANVPQPAVSRTATIEITDTSPGGAVRTTVIPLTLVESRGGSAVEIESRGEQLKVEATADRAGTSPYVRVKLHRWRTGTDEHGSTTYTLSTQLVWQPGERTVIGRSSRGDGTATEVAIAVR